MSEPTLRIATPGDIPRISQLLQASYSVLMRDDYTPEVFSAALPIITRANPGLIATGRYFVVETLEGELAGCGGWGFETPGTGEIEPGSAHIRHFAVHPEVVRQGIGAMLLDRCIDDARKEGVSRLVCYASVNGEPFYVSRGFATIGTISVELPGGLMLPSILMEATLA